MEDNYSDLKKWFSNKDFNLDTRLSIDNSDSNCNLKIRKIHYLYEEDKYVETIYPLELHSYKLVLNGKEVNVIAESDWIKDIIIINDEKLNIKITFYGSDNVLVIFAKLYAFKTPYQIPYAPPLKVNKNGITIKVATGNFNYELLRRKFHERSIEISLREYFGDQVYLSEIKNVDDLLGLSICQDYPKENPLQSSLGINICNINKEKDWTIISFDNQNTEMKKLWKEFLEIILSLNISEIRSGNIIYQKKEFDQFRKEFDL